MTKISYEFCKRNFETDSFVNLLLTNKLGSFFFYSQNTFSKYNGFIIRENEKMFKTIESINVINRKKIKEIKNKISSIEIHSEGLIENYFIDKDSNSLFYELSNERNVELLLDCRGAYDTRRNGRYYKIKREGDLIIIEYKKKTDGDESEKGKDDYKIYIAIKTDKEQFQKINSWIDKFYPYDFERKEEANLSVYDALNFKIKKAVFAVSENKKKAIETVKKNYEEFNSIKKKNENFVENQTIKKIKNKKVDISYAMSMFAINSLVVNGEGIYAGLPWFFQFWTRDTAFSIKSLIILERYDLVKELFFSFLEKIKEDGLMPNILPNEGINSLDSTGLIFFRLKEFLNYLDKKKITNNFFKKRDLVLIKKRLETALFSLLKNHSKHEFIINDKQETWMDTIPRAGARIEIQAMQIQMYDLLEKLSKKLGDKIANKFASHQKKSLHQRIKKYFFKGYLQDGLNDSGIRPNVFLAYFIYPNLLLKKEWTRTFDFAIKNLWLEWGGFSTVSQYLPEFKKKHTGINNESYHNGDSWFFINNIAAICMYRLNKEKYKKYIDKILESSTEDILSKGILGHHSEISSAEIQEAKGCLAQAWSSGTYIELVKEILN